MDNNRNTPPDDLLAVSHETGVLVLTLRGCATASNSTDIMRRVFEIIHEAKPTRLLIDCRAVEGRLDTLSTYSHVRGYPTLNHHPERIVVLERPENRDYYSFHETVAYNHGYHFRTMTEVNQAMQWLCGS
jgi:hypothetical protein